MLEKPPRAVWDHLALVTQVGLTFAGSLLLCFAVGYWLDEWLGTKGLFITVFILLGVAGGGYTVYRQIMALDDTSAKDDSNSQSGRDE
ncbi:ATP synthase [Dethiosulfatarculus sandiegensis]|uniref:ATP synthase n=1 Tax=Dethiosulfatarculus sandiegensis TaxID=1429043 RepID=A0A0D2JJH0_9BACT|nr:ATP synthase [Dethiosulfatarculus sandiegensis]